MQGVGKHLCEVVEEICLLQKRPHGVNVGISDLEIFVDVKRELR